MKERGIICKADEVRQLLGAERSTVSRMLKPRPDYIDPALGPCRNNQAAADELNGTSFVGGNYRQICLPLGNVGDHLYVREAFWIEHDSDCFEMCSPFDCGVNIAEDSMMRVQYCATPGNPEKPDEPGEWWGPDEIFDERCWIPWGPHCMSPNFFSKHSGAIMPRWASRITLEVVQSIVQPIDGEWVQFATVKRIDKAKA